MKVTPKNITPYLHTLLYHVPYFLSKYGSLCRFTGQGVEKTNDVVKRIHQCKSNKLDATTDALIVRKRIEHGFVSNTAREKRKYNKIDDNFWSVGKATICKSKKQKINEERITAEKMYNPQTQENACDMDIPTLRKRLLELGVKSKLRKKEKLVELLEKNLK